MFVLLSFGERALFVLKHFRESCMRFIVGHRAESRLGQQRHWRDITPQRFPVFAPAHEFQKSGLIRLRGRVGASVEDQITLGPCRGLGVENVKKRFEGWLAQSQGSEECRGDSRFHPEWPSTEPLPGCHECGAVASFEWDADPATSIIRFSDGGMG